MLSYSLYRYKNISSEKTNNTTYNMTKLNADWDVWKCHVHVLPTSIWLSQSSMEAYILISLLMPAMAIECIDGFWNIYARPLLSNTFLIHSNHVIFFNDNMYVLGSVHLCRNNLMPTENKTFIDFHTFTKEVPFTGSCQQLSMGNEHGKVNWICYSFIWINTLFYITPYRNVTGKYLHWIQ